MVRRIDLIPSSIKLILALAYDLLALSIAFYLAYIIRLGVDSIEISWHENLAIIAFISSTLAINHPHLLRVTYDRQANEPDVNALTNTRLPIDSDCQ